MSSNCCSSCQSRSPVCSADKNQYCAAWAQGGYCTSNQEYMQENCCVSCKTCESVWNDAAGGSTCGARIVYLESQGMNREAAKAQVGREFPSECGACKPAETGCQGDTNQNCEYWAAQGYCTRSAEYMKQNCCRSCEGGNGGAGGGDHCKPLIASQPKDRAINVILVPSAFNGDMGLWSQKARYVTDIFAQYKPFDAASIPQLNIWYVDIDMPGDNGQQCYFGCHNTPRLLCCPGKHNFIAHAKRHCGNGIVMNTLIIHNSDIYGGAGFVSDGAASCSTNSLSPQIAVHELGHSLFGLADEYSYSTQAVPDKHPNCDYAGCTKWADLQGRHGVGCVPGKCAGGRYYAAENSVMETFSYKFGESNERICCCKYLYHFATAPAFCDKFSQGGLNLQQFCATGLWRGEYTTLNSLNVAAQAKVDEQLTGNVVLANRVQTEYLQHVSTDPQGQQFIYVAAPQEWVLTRSRGTSDWVCVPAAAAIGDPGLFPKVSVSGDEDPTWESSFYLAPERETCPAGEEITSADVCWTAYQVLASKGSFKFPSRRGLLQGAFAEGVPSNCSIQIEDGPNKYPSSNQDSSPHFNTAVSDNSRMPEFRAICKGGKVSVYIRSANGPIVRQLTFLTLEEIEIPFPGNASNASDVNGTNYSSEILVPREFITVVLNGTETCHTDATPPTTTIEPVTTPSTTKERDDTGGDGDKDNCKTEEDKKKKECKSIGQLSTAERIFSPSLWGVAGVVSILIVAHA